MSNDRNVISLSFAKRSFEVSREQRKLVAQGEYLDQNHVVVFTRLRDACPDQLTLGNTTFYGTNTRTRLGMLIKAWRIGRRILRSSHDKRWIVTSQDPAMMLVGGALSVGKNVVHHVQLHSDFLSPHFRSESLYNWVRGELAYWFARSARAVRVGSKRAKLSLVQRGVPSHKITVLPVQTKLQEFIAVGTRRTYSPDGPLRLLFVGRLSVEKNIPALIEAVAAARSGADITLTILGSGPEEAALQALAAKLGVEDIVAFVPWSEDVPVVMAAHDVLCLVSWYEGWGIVSVEAAAAGMPVIMTDVGCAGEFIVHEAHGLVVPVGDTLALTQAVSTLGTTRALVEQYGVAGHKAAVAFEISDEEQAKQTVNTVLAATEL